MLGVEPERGPLRGVPADGQRAVLRLGGVVVPEAGHVAEVGVGGFDAAALGGFQRQLMDGGTCEATAYLQYGYRVAGMCLPLGNYHNMNGRGGIAAESISRADLLGLARFIEGLVRADARIPGRSERRSTAQLRRRLRVRSRGAGRQLARDPRA